MIYLGIDWVKALKV